MAKKFRNTKARKREIENFSKIWKQTQNKIYYRRKAYGVDFKPSLPIQSKREINDLSTKEIQKLNPEFKYSTLGTYFAQTGNTDLAIKYLTRSQQSEKDPYADYVLGAIYYNQGIEAERKGDAATAKTLKDKGV